jgi:protein-L-isoaspartate O-methyltransferase
MNNSKKGSIYITNCKRILSCYAFNFLELLSVKTRFFNKILMNIRRDVFLSDISMADLKNTDNVLVIGCGIFPTHCILISENVKTKVVGIDNSPKAVKLAKNYIKKQGLDDLIKIELSEGSDYSASNFNVVFVAVNVFPIDDVLKSLSKKLKSGSKVLCKSINRDIPRVIKKTGLSKYFEIKKMVDNPKTQSYLLVKK